MVGTGKGGKGVGGGKGKVGNKNVRSKRHIRASIEGITKQHAVWINKGTTSRVLCYLQRPKGVSDDEWQEFLAGLTLNLKQEKNA